MFDSGEQYGLLRRGDEVVGRLVAVAALQDASDVTGLFVPGPGYEPYRAVFENARDAAVQVDTSSSEECQQLWYQWRAACAAIESLELTFGEDRAPIESFTIDANWSVELAIPLWWLVTVRGWADA